MEVKHLGVLKTLFIVFARGKQTSVLVLSISIPIALVTSIALALSASQQQVQLLKDITLQSTSVVVSDSGLEVGVVEAALVFSGQRVGIQIHVVRDFNAYADLANARVVKSVKPRGKGALSIGVEIASRLRVDVNSTVLICVESRCFNSTITAIHRGEGYANYIAVTNSSDLLSYSKPLYFSRREGNVAATDILNSLSRDVSSITRLLALISIAAYTPILYLSINRVLNGYRDAIDVLKGAGASGRAIFTYSLILFSALSAIFALYGIALGVIAVHTSLWLLQFFGIVMPFKPVAVGELVITTSALYATLCAIASAVSAKRLYGGFQ
uniref:ABC transporter permease n=1 Tax=Ignisphaera aggregans TaxID=334771 RepID=A0A7C4BCA1_9CREN